MPYRAKILAVDDEPELTDLMHFHLVRAGHEVVTAANGWEAIAAVKSKRPDIILLDLMLPDLDGFGVCEILRGAIRSRRAFRSLSFRPAGESAYGCTGGLNEHRSIFVE